MSVERWSIWRANLDPVVGSEQGRIRPVLVISETAANDILPVVNVLPITSRKRGRRVYPNEALLAAGNAGLTEESLVLAYQIRTVDKRRLSRLYGKLDDISLQEQILSALFFQLGVKVREGPRDEKGPGLAWPLRSSGVVRMISSNLVGRIDES